MYTQRSKQFDWILLSNNKITSIDKDTFSSLNSLTKIDLDNNQITKVHLEV